MISRIFIILSVILFLAGCANVAKEEVENEDDKSFEFSKLKWIAGSWIGEVDSAIVFESWVLAGERYLQGESYTVSNNGDTTFTEKMTIEKYGKSINYIVSLANKKNVVMFKLVELNDRTAVFENPENDFPTRITYKHKADGSLHARIEGIKNGKEEAVDFHFSGTDD